MRKDLYAQMYELEEVYWWHVAKRRLVRDWLDRTEFQFGNKIYVDVGCGTGKMMEEMRDWKKWRLVTGLDSSDEALSFCAKRSRLKTIKANLEKELPLADNWADVITCLDVVEHVRRDQFLLKECARVLKPGGILMVTVPAHQFMWTYWDDVLGHKRRYSLNQLVNKLERAGFGVERKSYFYSFLLPVALVFRVMKSSTKNWKNKSDFFRLPKMFNNLLLELTRFERKLMQKMEVPLGLSVVCLARKRQL